MGTHAGTGNHKQDGDLRKKKTAPLLVRSFYFVSYCHKGNIEVVVVFPGCGIIWIVSPDLGLPCCNPKSELQKLLLGIACPTDDFLRRHGVSFLPVMPVGQPFLT